MKLLIISHTSHYLENGKIVGWGPTIREINHLTSIFDEIRHIAFLHRDPPPETSLPYASDQISLIPVNPSGGKELWKKIGILAMAPGYISKMKEHLAWTDIVHVRCPANISLIAIILLRFLEAPKYRWAKYDVNWSPDGREPLSFTFQRWWLKKGLHRGLVTVNGNWPDQPPFIRSFLNPCLTDEEIESARTACKAKSFSPPYHFLFAGRLEEAKGIGRALDILAKLHQKLLPFKFHIVGDGVERSMFEQKATVLGIQNMLHFYGWLSRPALNALYAQAHFLLLPSENEGWPKVLSESMAYGVVPIAGAVASIPQVLTTFQTGHALPAHDQNGFAEAILKYVETPPVWYAESKNGIVAAENFTYEKYLRQLTAQFKETWGLSPGIDPEAVLHSSSPLRTKGLNL